MSERYYDSGRRKSLAAGGITSAALIAGSYGGQGFVRRRFERHQERITGKPRMVMYKGRMSPSHSIKPIWMKGYMKPGRTQKVLEKHGAALDKLRKIFLWKVWRQTRLAGMAGLAGTGLAAGVMGLVPTKEKR